MVTRIYANAIAKFNESKLLDAEKLYRLIDAEFSDAVKMLCDYGYGGGIVDDGSYDIDAFISGETSALIDYALSGAPNEYVAKILTNKFLYGNAKAYYKAKITGIENAAAVYRMPDGELKAAIDKGDYSALTPFLADALTALDAEFAESPPNPKTVDIMLTKARYADDAYCARKSGNKSLKAYVEGETDFSNIISTLRARALKMSESSFLPLIIDGGKLSIEDITALFLCEDAVKFIRNTDYGFIVENCEEINLPLIEAKTENHLAEIWERESENMQSISPFVSYFIAQLGEYKTVKMILTCLRNGAREEIATRLRGIKFAI